MFTLFKSYLWEQRKFCNAVDRISKQSSDPELPHIEYENIESGLGKLNTALVKLHSNKKGIIFRKNDILFGKLRPYLKNWYLAEFKGIAVGDFWVLRSDKYLFIYYLIQTSRFFSISNISTGSKMPRSDWNLVSNCMFFIPNDAEAKVIGKTIQLVDYLIDLQQKKLEQMSQLKKFILNNLFSYRELPKVRFQKFTYPWEQRKLGEITDITMGQAPNSNSYTTNPKDMILVQGNADLSDGKVVPRIWTTSITKEAPKGDIILTVRAPVGEVAISDYKVVLGRGVAAIKGDLFIYYWLKFMQQNHAWDKFSTGSTFESINSSDIQNIACGYPVKSEQTLISSLLSKIYKSIHLQKQKIVYLKSLKKFLLQKLFI